MGYKTGISFFDSIISQSSRGDKSENIKELIVSARVTNVNLNSNSTIFSSTNEWQGMGTIQFQPVGGPVNEKTLNSSGLNYAKPLFSQIKNYPLVNEIVILFKLPSRQGIGDLSNTEEYYYLNTIGIWNHPHVNAYPNPLNNPSATSTNSKSFLEILAGNPNRTTDESTDLDLNGGSGGTFIESSIIHPLVPFAGDQILEGRFGNSIRLGNTSKAGGIITNNWSAGNNTKNGDPITIIKNGQPLNSSSEGYLPITEDINNDPTSIYLTSTQKIPFDIAVASTKEGEGSTIPYSNIITPVPKSPKSYNNPQVILNSGRLLFNTYTDSILFSSKKSIVLTSIEDLGIQSQTKNVNIVSDKGIVSLGKQNASESVILGDTFIDDFTALIDNLKTLCSALGKEGSLPIASSLANILSQSGGVLDNISNRSQAGDYKSKKVKTT